MRRVKFDIDVKVMLELNEPELELLIECSKAHYDRHCRSISEVGGFLYGMKNMLDIGEAERSCSFREIDTLCKCLEVSPLLYGKDPIKAVQASGIWMFMKQQLNDINREWTRLNPRAEEERPDGP